MKLRSFSPYVGVSRERTKELDTSLVIDSFATPCFSVNAVLQVYIQPDGAMASLSCIRLSMNLKK